MTHTRTPQVLISEVGPRDGLQSVKATMPTAAKLRWIDALHAAGLREIEVASFVPAKLLPQMADAAEVVRHALTLPGLTVMALVPNLRGAEAALAAGVHKLTIPVSASAAHSLANVRKTPRADGRRGARHRGAAQRTRAAGAGSRPACPPPSAARCKARCRRTTWSGWPPQCAAAGVDDVGLSDTTGMANPAQVRRLFRRLRAEIGDHDRRRPHAQHARPGPGQLPGRVRRGRAHLRRSLGGLGGCPYAPGASGNVVTEDLVFMFEAMGVSHRRRHRAADRGARSR